MAKAVAGIIWIFIFLQSSSAQKLPHSSNSSGICLSVACNTLRSLAKLKDCEVILGNLRLVILEKTVREHFQNISFPKLREITGFMVMYRVNGLHTLGTMFPNLARIRGREMIYNFALVVYDMPSLIEIGLYSLIKIDHGGVIIWDALDACYVHTIDWETIAPRSHIMLEATDNKHASCSAERNCTCGGGEKNYCWNNDKCQKFIEGPKAEPCHDQCLGCQKTDPNLCSVCRHYTDHGKCVSRCPDDTIILRDNKYCLTKDECGTLKGWAWNQTCVFDCPFGYERLDLNGTTTCRQCKDCKKICSTKNIHTLGAIQHADKCTIINGSLTIHTRAIPQVVEELQLYLKTIEEVTDYIHIYNSYTLNSLDILPSLRRIGGRVLKDGRYSLVIQNMKNLRELFLPSVTKNLKIGRGQFLAHGNPLLCTHVFEELSSKFEAIDIPIGLNGYSGNCSEAAHILEIIIRNESDATVFFSPIPKNHVQYTLLYVRLPLGTQTVSVPETCSEAQWQVADAEGSANVGIIDLKHLVPASTYAVCIETFDPETTSLARSSITQFTTPYDRPEPPFIWELNATSHHEVIIRWVDHKHYYKLITRYELDVILIDIPKEHQTANDHCEYPDDFFQPYEKHRHGVFVRPPKEYSTCDPECELFASLARDRLYEDYFDVCTSDDHRINAHEPSPPGNSSFGEYVRTLTLDINAPNYVFQVSGLAPFRDYKFRLRSCAKDKCSISVRNVVRTLKIPKGDVPVMTYTQVNDKGHIKVEWMPPEETNGPLLAYAVQVQIPKTRNNRTNMMFTESFCVSPYELTATVNLPVVSRYLVRVCATSLGTFSACGNWQEIRAQEMNYGWLWAGILFSVFVLSFALIFGYYCKKRTTENDDIPLIDMFTSTKLESDPPAVPVASGSGLSPKRDVLLNRDDDDDDDADD